MKEHLFFASSEPYMLYEVDSRYFIELWIKQKTGKSQAVEIKKEIFDQLFSETALPSEVL